jgi:hypothetical protein
MRDTEIHTDYWMVQIRMRQRAKSRERGRGRRAAMSGELREREWRPASGREVSSERERE